MTVPKTLIDGYNLLFQSQLVGKGRGRDWLPAARRRLVQLLHSGLTAAELMTTQLVFDAPRVGAAPEADVYASGLSVVFAVEHPEADDLLEQLIRQHPTPKQLTVVSSDARVRRCAQARRAVSLDADQFLEQLERGTSSPLSDSLPSDLSTPGDMGPDLLSETEVAYWLKEFGD